MAKRFLFKGMEVEELKKLPIEKLLPLIPTKVRRSIRRMSTKMKSFIAHMRKKDPKKTMKTQFREMVILPEMIDRKFGIYNGKEYFEVLILPGMVGRRLGEFSIPIKLVKHSGPGIGATRGSKSVELK
jgi:small subunit ribosomal protein S19